jgi:MoaA/NifB/PqqE/SkfB family radical SAM enzyme
MKLALGQKARIGRAFLTRKVPVYAHYGITHRCNLTCKMCGIWRYGNRKEELSLPEIGQMAQRMGRLGVVQCSIGGGEPFACDFGVKNFSISLDSLYPARFDDICEKEGSWDEAVRTMTLISSLLPDKDALPTINCVVSNLNLEELPDIVRFAQAIGFHVSFLPIELLADPKDGVRNWEARFVRYRPEMGLNVDDGAGDALARIDAAYDQLVRMKKEGWPILNSTPYLEASRHYLKTGRFPAEGCDAGRLYFSVAPNGQFTICHRTQQQHVHFLDPNFEEYYHSAVFERARQLEAGSCEGCMRACWIDTSFMFRTMEGFVETARMGAFPRPRAQTDYAMARTWARE